MTKIDSRIMLACATAPGNVAEDGDPQTGNGLYTQLLLSELQRPVSKIDGVFELVSFKPGPV